MFTSTNDSPFSSPFCIEFDPVSRNLIVGNIAHSFIEVINVDNRNRATLFAESNTQTGVGHPLMVAVNNVDNEVYWIDAGLDAVPKKIGGVKMDGTQPRIIVQYNLNQPAAIFFHAK